MAEQVANGCIALEAQGQNPLWPLIVYIQSCDVRGQIQAARLDSVTFWPVMLLHVTKGDTRRVADLVQVACFYNTRTTLGGRTGLDRKDRQCWEVFGALMETSPTLAPLFLSDHDPEAIRLSLWRFQIHVIRNGLAVFDGCAVYYGCTQGAKGRVY